MTTDMRPKVLAPAQSQVVVLQDACRGMITNCGSASGEVVALRSIVRRDHAGRLTTLFRNSAVGACQRLLRCRLPLRSPG